MKLFERFERWMPVIDNAMLNINYVRVGKRIYMSKSSTVNVSSLIYFEFWSDSRDFLSAHFAITNREAELWSVRCARTYGGEVYKSIRNSGKFDSKNQFDIGRIAKWGIRSSLAIADYSELQFTRKLINDLRAHIIPLVDPVRSLDDLYVFLLQDTEQLSWLYSNGLIRSGEVVYIGVKIGKEEKEILGDLFASRESMCPPSQAISMALRNKNFDPMTYISKLISECSSHCGR